MSIIAAAAAGASARVRVTVGGGEEPPTGVPAVYWMADYESGDYALSGWDPQSNGGVASAVVNTAKPRTGTYSLEVMHDTTNAAVGDPSVVRLTLRTAASGTRYAVPDEMYFGAWYWLQADVTPTFFWQIWDVKSGFQLESGGADSHLLYSINIDRVDATHYRLRLGDRIGPDGRFAPGNAETLAFSPSFEAEQWIHIEWYYRWHYTDGQITGWLNGTQIWNFDGVTTEFDWTLEPGQLAPVEQNSRLWKINHYSNGSDPNVVKLWLDDCIMASERLGPHWNAGKMFRKFQPILGTDDAAETSGGTVTTNGTGLALGVDTIGICYKNVTIPQGATIHSAVPLFASNAISATATSLTVYGQAADSAATFAATANNISGRAKTTASASWSPAAWDRTEDRSCGQRGPECKDLVQEIVDRAGWASGNNLALLFEGTGNRNAAAVDHATRRQSELIVIWS